MMEYWDWKIGLMGYWGNGKNGVWRIHGLNRPKSTVFFLERGGDGCELRVVSCEVRIFDLVFLSQFFKALPRKPVTRNPKQALVIFRRWI